MKPSVSYYPETNSMWLVFSETPSVESEEIAEDIVVAFGPAGEVVAIEFIGGVRELFAELLSSPLGESEEATKAHPAKGRKRANPRYAS